MGETNIDDYEVDYTGYTDGDNIKIETCEKNQWHCNSGECIDKTLRCDNNSDCQDSSDETDCNPNTPVLTKLPTHSDLSNKCDKRTQFQCGIKIDKRNEYVIEPIVLNFGDPISVPQVEKPEQVRCIPLSFRCDGHNDCQD